jgi:hypothetical protein
MSDLVGNQLDDEPAAALSAERLTGGAACKHGEFAPYLPVTAFIDIEGP